MSYFHPIKRVEDRERMLERILSLQTQVRTKREKDQLASSSRNQKYTKIFEPITKTLEHIADIPTPSKKNLLDTDVPTTNNDLVDLISPEIIKKEEEEASPGELYRSALRIVSVNDRDDGTFGLNTNTQKIGDYTFTIDGDTLNVTNDDGDDQEFIIDDIEEWIVLLAKSPGRYLTLSCKKGQSTPSKRRRETRQKKEYIPSVKRYVEIANKLNLIKTAEESGKSYKTLSKYTVITRCNERLGNGFLFSIKPPPFLHKTGNKKNFIKPSTVVIPSDKKGLMRALVQALAELRAGNTSMRNLVVPFKKQNEKEYYH